MKTVKQADAMQYLYDNLLDSDNTSLKLRLAEWNHVYIFVKFPLVEKRGLDIWQVSSYEIWDKDGNVNGTVRLESIGFWFPQKKKFVKTIYKIFHIVNADEPWVVDSEDEVDGILAKTIKELEQKAEVQYPTMESIEAVLPEHVKYAHGYMEHSVLEAIIYDKDKTPTLFRNDMLLAATSRLDWIAISLLDDDKERKALEDSIFKSEMENNLLCRLWDKYAYQKTREEIAKDPSPETAILLKIHDAVTDGNYAGAKTFRVTINENGFLRTLKAEAAALRHMEDCINRWSFIGERPLNNVEPEDILRIEYGRNVVYKKGA